MSVPMQPVSPQMLVPLLDPRSKEMAELLAHPANASWTHLGRNMLGSDVWDNRCLPLWTGTDRAQVSDAGWLRQSRDLLLQSSPSSPAHGGNGVYGRLWHEFCGMVGWDSGAADPAEEGQGSDKMDVRPRLSRESLKMSSIAEEEPEDSKRKE